MPFQPALAPLPHRWCQLRHRGTPVAGASLWSEGRQATVYQVVAARTRGPQSLSRSLPGSSPLSLSERLSPFAKLPALEVCRRTTLTPQRHSALLRQYPDLAYAALMPWIDGPPGRTS